jgi:16S rRNA (cytosine967-C5)-methyltransferase
VSPPGAGSRGPRPPARPSARGVALEALARIDDGAYANLVMPALLERSRLSARDRAFATDLVYGTTRMRAALDWILGPHLHRKVEPTVRRVLRLGAYQLRYLRTPAHAAVGETVTLAPARARSLVNAVLRNVALHEPPPFPDLATELSYPPWVVARLTADLGEAEAEQALRTMNEPAAATVRGDGYVQDRASQLVAAAVGASPGEVVLDMCAAPGGKATALDAALVVAADISPGRVGLIAANARGLGRDQVVPVVADGVRPPFRPGTFDRVLVDAPCSGLGVLRRRPDSRWRVTEDDVAVLSGLQRLLLDSAATLVRPGGWVVYSVCTLTAAETIEVDAWMAEAHPGLVAQPPPDGPWRRVERGARLLPHDEGTDGMYLLRLRRT